MIRLSKPTLKRKDMDSVLTAMVDETLAPGTRYQEFSQMLKVLTASEGCALVRTYPRAVEAACRVAGVHDGSKVIMSALSPGWYCDVLENLGAEYLLADVEPRTACTAAGSVQELLKMSPTHLLIHSPLGNCPDRSRLGSFNLPLIEDISQNFGTEGYAPPVGDSPYLQVVAFEEDGMITTGGGAAVTVFQKTHLKPLLDEVNRCQGLEQMPDFNAALGISQLKNFPAMLERRREFLAVFRSAVQKTRHAVITEEYEDVVPNGFCLPLLIESRLKEVVKFTRRYGVEAINPFEQCAARRSEAQEWPNSAAFISRTLQFPLYPLLGQDQLKTLVKVLSTLP